MFAGFSFPFKWWLFAADSTCISITLIASIDQQCYPSAFSGRILFREICLNDNFFSRALKCDHFGFLRNTSSCSDRGRREGLGLKCPDLLWSLKVTYSTASPILDRRRHESQSEISAWLFHPNISSVHAMKSIVQISVDLFSGTQYKQSITIHFLCSTSENFYRKV